VHVGHFFFLRLRLHRSGIVTQKKKNKKRLRVTFCFFTRRELIAQLTETRGENEQEKKKKKQGNVCIDAVSSLGTDWSRATARDWQSQTQASHGAWCDWNERVTFRLDVPIVLLHYSSGLCQRESQKRRRAVRLKRAGLASPALECGGGSGRGDITEAHHEHGDGFQIVARNAHDTGEAAHFNDVEGHAEFIGDFLPRAEEQFIRNEALRNCNGRWLAGLSLNGHIGSGGRTPYATVRSGAPLSAPRGHLARRRGVGDALASGVKQQRGCRMASG
jgi:hypothetical protein